MIAMPRLSPKPHRRQETHTRTQIRLRCALRALLSLLGLLAWAANPLAQMPDDAAFHPFQQSADPPETELIAAPLQSGSALPSARGFGAAAAQPNGSMTGRIVFTSAGHGWTWTANGWRTQRGVALEMNEDYGNLDQMTLFVAYCFNAGATVVPLRPVGYQTNEVVLDNDSPRVSWDGSWSDSTSGVFFGKAGAVPYRFAAASQTETALATYTPAIPVAGRYPVYCWAAHGANRIRQLYRIFHTGGETRVRIPHDLVGKGWV